MGVRWSARALSLSTLLAVAAVLAVGASIGAGRASAARTRPPCTRSALQAGLARGAARVPHARVGRPFGCDRGWAYAAVNTREFTLTSVFRARGGRWVTASRGPACTRGEIPRRIRRPACNSN